MINETGMNTQSRIISIDIMRGLTLLLMLFVNDLNMDIAPHWLGHMKADFDGMGLADWVFPGFLFIVGMAIPFAFVKRLNSGNKTQEIILHIITRSLTLLLIGVLMLNSERVDPHLTGMNQNLWAILMYLSVFLIWNDYSGISKNRFLTWALRITGIIMLIFLAIIFRSGKPENHGYFVTEWWGILGLIGWGYLVSALTYLILRDSILKTSLAVIFFLALNILSASHLLSIGGLAGTIFGVIIDGNVPLIVMTGLLAGVILKKANRAGYGRTILIYLSLGAFCIAGGFILRKWFIISKIYGTPSWGMICNGISFLVFALLYWITDIKGKQKWTFFIKPAGENSLTTYLAPDILYFTIWMSGVNVLFYKDSQSPVIVVAGSIIWAILMAGLTALLSRIHIRLKI
jgi:heparan-alpha-glucosaminide N-acetyltransferase